MSMYQFASGGLRDIVCMAASMSVGAYGRVESTAEKACGVGPSMPACLGVAGGGRTHGAEGYGHGGAAA